ncbi:Lipoprotein OS=Castellaniella defragrans OX=75697 GN=HNR28_002735 PE=4 SV=1 [Castellaniella defragrans]
MRVIRFLLLLSCAALLAGCAPRFDWRPVIFGEQGANGVLPDKPDVQTKAVPFESHSLKLTMHSARAGSVLFALGEAPLPPALARDPQERARLERCALPRGRAGLLR